MARAAPPEPAPGGSPRARRRRPDARRGARAWTTEWPASAPPEGGSAIRRVTRGVMMVVRDSWHENTPTDESREKTTAVGISKRGKKAPLKKPI